MCGSGNRIVTKNIRIMQRVNLSMTEQITIVKAMYAEQDMTRQKR